MNFDLPGDSSRGNAVRWLKRLIRHLGPGFHIDTTPNDYTAPDGRPLLTPSECVILERSLDRLLEILGSEQPYVIGANATATLLCESRGWKPPLQFYDPEYQQALLRDGTREQLIAWLRWNDPNGSYSDRDLQADDQPPLTRVEAQSLMRDQIERE
jgi:hypothetical protein